MLYVGHIPDRERGFIRHFGLSCRRPSLGDAERKSVEKWSCNSAAEISKHCGRLEYEIACQNALIQTVLSGKNKQIDQVVAALSCANLKMTKLVKGSVRLSFLPDGADS